MAKECRALMFEPLMDGDLPPSQLGAGYDVLRQQGSDTYCHFGYRVGEQQMEGVQSQRGKWP